MKRIAFLTLILFVAGPAWTKSDADEAVAAYKAGTYERAIELLRPLAEKGSAEAQYYLGECYRRGEGVRSDFNQALKWYFQAAEQGHGPTLNLISNAYAFGKGGFPKSSVDAAKWFHKAAKSGYSWGQGTMGTMYLKGDGVPQNDVEAVKWFMKAAQNDDPFISIYLGQMYERGQGVPKDVVQAYKWYVLSEGDWAYGTPKNVRLAKKLEKSMTTAQIDAAEKQITEFRAARAKKAEDKWDDPNWSDSYRRIQQGILRKQGRQGP